MQHSVAFNLQIIRNYVKQKYLQYLDSLEVTDVYYGYGYTAGVLVDIIIGEYLESELVGAVFKDTSNTAQAAQKAEKAVAESGEEVLDQAEKAIESGTTTKPNQVHHFATNKSKKYTSQFESITKKYGLELDGDWNKQSMPHQGRSFSVNENL